MIEQNPQEDQPPRQDSVSRSMLVYILNKKWYPNPNIYSTMGILCVLAAMFLVLAFLMFAAHKHVVEITITEYEELEACKKVLHRTNQHCDVPIDVTRYMQSPIYVLYSLDNFYQNHRRYVQSKNTDQLSGKIIDAGKAKSSCYPVVFNRDLHTKYAWDQKTLLDPDAVANPCGIIAKTFFNDTYLMFTKEGRQIRINSHNISLLNDLPNKYKRAPDSSRIQWIDPTDQHFIVWMRTAGLPSSRKLYGVIEQDLEPGRYFIRITNNYDARMINADKGVVLTTANMFGGTNIFMTVAFAAAGAFCIGALFVFLYKLWATNWTFGVSR